VDKAGLQELIRQLKSTDEGLRLRAANLLSLEMGEDMRLALASLKDAFLHDPNPAVRFLAAKALKNQGIEPDDLSRGGPVAQKVPEPPVEVDSPDEGLLSFQGGIRAFWLTAQEYLRTPFNGLCDCLRANPERVGPWMAANAEDLGIDMVVPHLLEWHFREVGQSKDCSSKDCSSSLAGPPRVAEVAGRWHALPRESLSPVRGDLRGPGLDLALSVLASSPIDAIRAIALRFHEPQDVEAVRHFMEGFGQSSPMLLDSLVEVLKRLGQRRRDLAVKILSSCLGHFRPGQELFRLVGIARLCAVLVSPATLAFVKAQLPQAEGAAKAALIDVVARHNISDTDKVTLVGGFLKDQNPLVVIRTLACLWNSSQRSFIIYLISRYLNHPEPSIRSQLACALGDVAASEVLPYLVQLLNDPDVEVRSQAWRGLDRLQGEEVMHRVAGLLTDPHDRVRASAFRFILERSVGDRQLLTRVGLRIDKAPPAVVLERPDRLNPAGVGGKDGGSSKVEVSLQDPWVAEMVLSGLESVVDPQVIPLAETQVLSKNPWVRARATRLLWKLGELWSVDNVNDLLSDSDPSSWEAGVVTLAELGVVCRQEVRLLQHPILRSALRRHPTFESHAKKGAK